jgi:hypothetical protein
VEKQPGKAIVSIADRRMIMATVPEKFSVFITVKTKATISGKTAVGEGSNALLAGSKLSIKGPKYMIETMISKVNLEG